MVFSNTLERKWTILYNVKSSGPYSNTFETFTEINLMRDEFLKIGPLPIPAYVQLFLFGELRGSGDQ